MQGLLTLLRKKTSMKILIKLLMRLLQVVVFIIVLNARHTENNSEGKRLLLDTAVLTDLLRKAGEIVSKDECWSQGTRGSVQDFCCIVDGKLFEDISKLCETFIESNDPEKFFEQFYWQHYSKSYSIS